MLLAVSSLPAQKTREADGARAVPARGGQAPHASLWGWQGRVRQSVEPLVLHLYFYFLKGLRIYLFIYFTRWVLDCGM